MGAGDVVGNSFDGAVVGCLNKPLKIGGELGESVACDGDSVSGPFVEPEGVGVALESVPGLFVEPDGVGVALESLLGLFVDLKVLGLHLNQAWTVCGT